MHFANHRVVVLEGLCQAALENEKNSYKVVLLKIMGVTEPEGRYGTSAWARGCGRSQLRQEWASTRLGLRQVETPPDLDGY